MSFPDRFPVFSEVEQLLEPFRQEVKVQGDLVRQLKATEGTDPAEIKRAVAELKARKKKLEDKGRKDSGASRRADGGSKLFQHDFLLLLEL